MNSAEEITLRGHTSFVSAVAWSPDGKLLASGGGDCQILIWNIETKDYICSLTGHTKAITCLAWSPDGKRIVSGSFDHTVRVWDIETKAAVHTLVGHQYMVIGVDWTGSIIASGSGSSVVASANHLILWNADTGERLMTNEWEGGNFVEFSPDGTLVTLSYYHIIRIFRKNTTTDINSPLNGLLYFAEHVIDYQPNNWGNRNGLSVSPDGLTIASSDYQAGILLTGIDGVRRGKIDFNEADSISWLSNSLLATCRCTNSNILQPHLHPQLQPQLQIWNVDGSCVGSFLKKNRKFQLHAVECHGDSIAAGGSDNNVYVLKGLAL